MKKIENKIDSAGGADELHTDCKHVLACHSNLALHLLPEFYVNKRSALFRLLDAVDLQSTTQNDLLIKAMRVIQEYESQKIDYLSLDLNLSFTTREWRKLLVKKTQDRILIDRQQLEICVFSHLAEDLHSGDIFITGANSFADYRESLLSIQECRKQIDAYCQSMGSAIRLLILLHSSPTI